MQETLPSLNIHPPLSLFRMQGDGNCGPNSGDAVRDIPCERRPVSAQNARGIEVRARVAVWMTRWAVANPTAANTIWETLQAADDGADPDVFHYNVTSFQDYAIHMAKHAEWVDVTWWSMYCGCYHRTVQVVTLDNENRAHLSFIINAPVLDPAPVVQGIVDTYPAAQPQMVYVAHYGGADGLHWDAISQGPMDAPITKRARRDRK